MRVGFAGTGVLNALPPVMASLMRGRHEFDRGGAARAFYQDAAVKAHRAGV